MLMKIKWEINCGLRNSANSCDPHIWDAKVWRKTYLRRKGLAYGSTT